MVYIGVWRYIFLCPIPLTIGQCIIAFGKSLKEPLKIKGHLGNGFITFPIDRTDSQNVLESLVSVHDVRFSLFGSVSQEGWSRLAKVQTPEPYYIYSILAILANCRNNTPKIDWNLFQAEVFELDSVGYRSLISFWHNSGSSISSNQYNLILYDSYII